jgi:hypothetical protein
VSAAGYSQGRIDSLFAAIDSSDAEGFSKFLTADGVFRFGSAVPVVGRQDISAVVGAFFGTIASSKHHIANTIASGDTLVCEGNVTYTRHDSTNVTVPFVDILELSGDLINDYKIYIDISPLFVS